MLFKALVAAAATPVALGGVITARQSSQPTVTLSYGSFAGSTANGLTSFLGMPYAAPPVGNLRFAPPTAPTSFSGTRNATAYGAACYQQNVTPPPIQGLILPATPSVQSEDCLFINVIAPASIPSGTKLPVLFWLYGGGFEVGDTSQYPGDFIVARSISEGTPIIFVSANYRLNGFGFLAGKEVLADGSTNAGIRDQRFAMQWINSYISQFGGDPSKVTLWGNSAGAISVGLHLLINDGATGGLYRGAFMNSGSPYALRTNADGQVWYNTLVSLTGCSGSSNTLACLRSVSASTLFAAINQTPSMSSYTALNLIWQPRLDGVIFKRKTQDSIRQGKYAKVPFVTGDCDDEGTFFTNPLQNITTEAQFRTYVQTNYLPNANSTQIAAVAVAYPQDPTVGSPYGTGTANQVTSQWKRLASFQGDLIFQAPRRFFLSFASQTQNAWAFLYKRGKSTPDYGVYHTSDLIEFFNFGFSTDWIGTDALINFTNSLNPNVPSNSNSLITTSGVNWPTWNTNFKEPPLFTFQDGSPATNITADTYRAVPMLVLNSINEA